MARSEIEPKGTNTILYCTAYEETVRFYRDLLKLKVAMEKDWFVEFQLQDRGFVSLADAGRTRIPAGTGAGITLSWQVEDLRALRYRLLDMGIEVPSNGAGGRGCFSSGIPRGTESNCGHEPRCQGRREGPQPCPST